MRIPTSPVLALLPCIISAQFLTSTAPAETPAETTTVDSIPAPSADSSDHAWSPILTRTIPLPSIPLPTSAEIFHDDLRRALSHKAHHLKHRDPAPEPQATGQGPPPVLTQVSPIMTAPIISYDGTIPVQIEIVYTQLFSSPLDQWDGPQAGTIGLGTIQGEVGVVKTKRSLPTQAPMSASIDENSKSAEMDITEESEPKLEVVDDVKRTGAGAMSPEPALAAGSAATKETIALENKTGKVVDSSAGSALALILAITAMIIA